MSDFLLDKAFMALQSKRYSEAQSAYEEILKSEYTVDAWCGLGACKMFQLASGQSLDEVIYCYNKALTVNGSDKIQVDRHLISHVNVVLTQYAAYAIAAIEQAIQAEKDATKSAIIGLAAAAVGGMSSNLNTKIIAGVAAGAAGAVAIGKFSEIKDSKEIASYCASMLENTHAAVQSFLLENDKIQEAIDLSENVATLSREVYQALPEKVRKSIETKERVAASHSIETGDLVLDSVFALNRLPVAGGWLGYKLEKHGPVIEHDIKNIEASGINNHHGITAKWLADNNDVLLFAVRNSAGTVECIVSKSHCFCVQGSGLKKLRLNWSDINYAEHNKDGNITLNVSDGKPGGISLSAFVEPGKSEAAQLIADYINTSLITKKQVLIDTTERQEQSEKEESTESNEPIEEIATPDSSQAPEEKNVTEADFSDEIKTESFSSDENCFTGYDLPLSRKYDLNDETIFYGALLQRRQSEVGFLKKDRYKKLFMKAIIKQHSVKFMDWGNLGLELKNTDILDNESIVSRFSHISVD